MVFTDHPASCAADRWTARAQPPRPVEGVMSVHHGARHYSSPCTGTTSSSCCPRSGRRTGTDPSFSDRTPNPSPEASIGPPVGSESVIPWPAGCIACTARLSAVIGDEHHHTVHRPQCRQAAALGLPHQIRVAQNTSCRASRASGAYRSRNALTRDLNCTSSVVMPKR